MLFSQLDEIVDLNTKLYKGIGGNGESHHFAVLASRTTEKQSDRVSDIAQARNTQNDGDPPVQPELSGRFFPLHFERHIPGQADAASEQRIGKHEKRSRCKAHPQFDQHHEAIFPNRYKMKKTPSALKPVPYLPDALPCALAATEGAQ